MSAIGGAVLGSIAGEISKSLVGNVLRKLRHERHQFSIFAEEVVAFERDFQFLSAFLEDAQKKIGDGSSAVKEWLCEVNDVVMDAEDILEYCACALSGTMHSNYLLCFVKFSRYRFIRKIGKEIRTLMKRIDRIKDKIPFLQLIASSKRDLQHDAESSFSPAENPHLRSSILSDECLSVDLEDKIRDVLGKVDTSSVVSVVGMGGIGKTRLLQHVYKKLESRYEFSLWLSVSQTFSIFQLQLDILDKLGERGHSKASVARRKEVIHERLNGREGLVVMDDVWDLKQEEKHKYLNIFHKFQALGLPPNCKILISTRDEDVAGAFGGIMYKMSFLSFEDSMRLFRLHFLSGSTNAADNEAEEEETVTKIVQRCKGLPLAIIAMAGLLRHKERSQWRELLQQFKDAKLDNVAYSAVLLSYKALPLPQKLCFSYLALYPEDYEIPKKRMVRCWKAEGFVQSENESEEIWRQLCRRYLLQRTDLVSYARMHDIVRDVAVIVLREGGGVCEEGYLPQQFAKSAIRRISLGGASIPEGEECPAALRTLLALPACEWPKGSRFFANATALRVLCLSEVSIPCLPDGVANLKILKYLDISMTRINGIPDCVEDFKCLEYLFINDAPSGIPQWIDNLQQLISVGSLQRTYWQRRSAKAMPRLRRLHNIWIEITSDRDFSNAVGGLRNLEGLILQCTSGTVPTLALEEELKCGLKLLEATRIRVPASISHYSRLQSLSLEKHREGYPKEICELPCLIYLYIATDRGSEVLPEEYGRAGAFPKLQLLIVEKMKKLKRLPSIEERAMPELQLICLSEYEKLEMLPGLSDGALPKLHGFHLYNCPKLVNGISGEDWQGRQCNFRYDPILPYHGAVEEELKEAIEKRVCLCSQSDVPSHFCRSFIYSRAAPCVYLRHYLMYSGL